MADLLSSVKRLLKAPSAELTPEQVTELIGQLKKGVETLKTNARAAGLQDYVDNLTALENGVLSGKQNDRSALGTLVTSLRSLVDTTRDEASKTLVRLETANVGGRDRLADSVDTKPAIAPVAPKTEDTGFSRGLGK